MVKHGNFFCFPHKKKSLIIYSCIPTNWNIGMIKPIYKKKGGQYKVDSRKLHLRNKFFDKLSGQIVHINTNNPVLLTFPLNIDFYE